MQTNIYPINLSFEEFQISRIRFTKEILTELRLKHNKTHSFFRDGDYIYISNNEKDNFLDLANREDVTLNTIMSPKVVSGLIKHIFFRTFISIYDFIRPTSFYPFRFLSTQEKDDLIYSFLPANLQGIISYKKEIEIQLREFEIENFNSNFGLIINTSYRWQLTKDCEILKKEGFDLVGLDVARVHLHLESKDVLDASEDSIGKITKIDKNIASIDTNEGQMFIPLEELVLEKNTYNIRSYLEFTLGEETASDLIAKTKDEERKRYNNSNILKEITKIANTISQLKGETIIYKNNDGFQFTIVNVPLSSNSKFIPQKPNFIFDQAKTQIEKNSPDVGLNNFGPWDSISFEKNIHIVGVCAKNNRGSFSEFLAKLINGVPDSKWFKRGFMKKYEFQNITHDIWELSNITLEEYLITISKNLTNKNKPDILL